MDNSRNHGRAPWTVPARRRVNRFVMVRAVGASMTVLLLGTATACGGGGRFGSGGGGGCSGLSGWAVGAESTNAAAGCGATPPVDPCMLPDPGVSARETQIDPSCNQSNNQPTLPSDLVGTWHGGVGNNYFLTLTADGHYQWEHKRVGPFDNGIVTADGHTLRFTSSVNGERKETTYSLSLSPEVYGNKFTTLHLGNQSYVR